VLAYEPPARLLLSWHIDGAYRVDPDPAKASEVEVRFVAEGDGTRVELEHRHFERHADGGEEVAGTVGSEGGWSGLLAMYAQAASA
jgi:uncharacterized protein YndB with AHSA1/START domain